jgi:hypothetical protein
MALLGLGSFQPQVVVETCAETRLLEGHLVGHVGCAGPPNGGSMVTAASSHLVAAGASRGLSWWLQGGACEGGLLAAVAQLEGGFFAVLRAQQVLK